MAGNQLGKTLAGGFEAAMHATGRYPDWWQGRRFDRPTIGWACGVTGEVVRDTVQKILRHILLWYFSALSVVGVVYGSLATTIVGLLSLEIASIILLLGAQVIAEYERLQDGDTATPGELKTDPARVEVR
jgi:Terminase large subunit, T4likevirus-type, N-terminal